MGMDKRIKARWVKDLRSGKYKQGHGCLKDSDNNFCCLGVLCDIVDKTQWDDEVNSMGNYAYRDQTEYLPGEVIEISQIPMIIPGKKELDNITVQEHLTDMNDGDNLSLPPKKPKSFKQIALWIERYL